MKQGIKPGVAIGVIAAVLIVAGVLVARAFMAPDKIGATESMTQYQQHMQQNQGALQSKMDEKSTKGGGDYASKMKAMYSGQNKGN